MKMNPSITEKITESISTIAAQYPASPVFLEFVERIEEGCISRDENPYTHFCVYFAGYDRETKRIFIGHHIKSGLWLFNGGHLDQGENPEEALEREMGEEWGVKVALNHIGVPKLLTITSISNPTKQKCTRHYDIWYFVPLSETDFKPDQTLLAKEFYTTGWKTMAEAKAVITDANNLKAISEFEKLFDQKIFYPSP